MMLAVIWMTLSFSMMGSVQTNRSHTIGAVPKSEKRFANGWSITFNGGLTSTSEAGLCVIIQCSFTHDAAFKPTSAIWFKCPPQGKCDRDRDIIFHSVDDMKAQAPFIGRVALLEPNTTQKSCSITINDLTESDSGSYRFRGEGQLNGRTVGYNFDHKKLLRVTGLRQKPQIELPPALTEGLQTTLTCTAPGLCSGTPPNITWTWRKTGHSALDISLIQSDATIFQMENLTGIDQRHSSNLTFTASSEHDGSEVACQVTFERNIKSVETVTLNVTYLKMPIIKGNSTVEEGGTLNLTCDAEHSPPSTIITWTELSSNKTLQNGTQRASLVIPMVTGEQSGRYSCTAQHLNKTLTTFTDITVMTFPTILIGSECALQLRTLICVCISEGFPLPTIRWPLLKNRSVYSVVTTVLNSTVNSTLSLTVEDHYNTSVKCLSQNNVKTVNKRLLIIKQDEPKHKVVQNEGFFSSIAEVKTVIAFLIGFTLPTICYLAWTFHRCRERNSGYQSETMQMVTRQNHQTGGGQGVDGGEQTPLGEALQGVGDAEGDQKEVEYASIDYSQLKRRSPCKEAEHKQQTAETEYAEVKREERNRDQDSGTEYSGMLKREEEEEETIVECEDSKTEEEDREDTALYSNVM